MEEFLQQLNDAQREAVLYNEGPSLVIAGAGSGKTRVLTYKIAYLLKSGISPYSILALTFTNKAAREMKSRIAEITGIETANRLWMGTFHSVFSRILRREAERIGYSRDYTVYDAQDSKNLIKAIIKEKELDDKIYKPSIVQNRISGAKNALITPIQYESDKSLIEYDHYSKKPRIHEIYTNYWNRCRTADAMDFDDLLLYTYLLFKENPDIRQRYQNQFRFILVDEYQDTNSAQHEIVRQLAEDHHRVCVVGDDAQSIYSFRGANIDNILNFRKTYPESKLFKLEQNYRSTQTIVNAANSVIQKNKEQIPKEVYSKKDIGQMIPVISAYSDYEEAYIAASRIAEMRMLNNYEYRDFAILYRTNAQSRTMEEQLRKINIPYRIYGGLSFYQRKEIKDAIAYMRMVVNPSDEEAFKRIINYPARGIGDTTLNKILTAANMHQVSLWKVLSHLTEYNLSINKGTQAKLDAFRMLIESFQEINKDRNAYESGSEIIRKTGLINELYSDKTPEGISRIENLEELVNSLYEFVSLRMEEGQEEIRLRDFLAEISLLTDQDTNNEEDANRVNLMTIHSAKGLEFKNVLIVGLEEDLFPSELSKHEFKGLEEERRLFYVALTRAQENVVLTYAKNRFRNGQSLMCTPSRFIKDIDKKFLRMPKEISLETPDNQAGFSRAGFFSKFSSGKNEEPPKPSFSSPGKLYKIERDPMESVTHQSIGDLHIDSTIRHERFGIGKVTELSGEKENAKATVEFENFGKKQLLLKFAKFEVLD